MLVMILKDEIQGFDQFVRPISGFCPIGTGNHPAIGKEAA
jgi:hypothetical protein